MPPQVSLNYTAQVLEDSPAELRAEKGKVERLGSARGSPLVGLDETAMVQSARDDEQRLLVVRAAAIIVRHDAREWMACRNTYSVERET